jgi:homeobox protein cut-like
MAAAAVENVEAATQAWVAFGLASRQIPQLEETSNQIKQQRDQSSSNRKRLADTTKQFKKAVKSTETSTAANLALLTEEHPAIGGTSKAIELLGKECRTTIKAYQEEIDNLTRRCKAADSAFGTLFQSLTELPDPAPILVSLGEQQSSSESQVQHLLQGMEEMHAEMKQVEGSYQSQLAEKQDQHAREVADLQQQIAKLAKATPAVPASQPSSHNSNNGGSSRAEKEELIQLRREVAEYEVEFRGLKNQDITIRKLEAKISELQENQADHLEQELKKARDELAETEGRRAAEALEREAAMELRYKKVELELRAERAGREATRNHLLEADEGAGEREAAWEAQRQIIMDDSERLRETLHEATRERDELRLKTALLDDKNNAAATGSSPNTPSRHGGPPSSGNGIGMAELMLERKAYEAEVSLYIITMHDASCGGVVFYIVIKISNNFLCL